MALFGQHGELAKHMPLLQHPHAYQVILALRWEPAVQAQIQHLLATNHLVSLAPKAFDLERFAPASANPLTQFSADIYAGHFERGGERRLTNVTVHVQQVVFFTRLPTQQNSSPRDSTAVTELPCFNLIHWQQQPFLVEQIHSGSTQDRIFHLETDLSLNRELSSERIPAAVNTEPSTATCLSLDPKMWQANPTLKDWGVQALELVYQESEDFQ